MIPSSALSLRFVCFGKKTIDVKKKFYLQFNFMTVANQQVHTAENTVIRTGRNKFFHFYTIHFIGNNCFLKNIKIYHACSILSHGFYIYQPIFEIPKVTPIQCSLRFQNRLSTLILASYYEFS